MNAWPLTTTDLEFVGNDVSHPECVVALASGDVYAGDRRGRIVRIDANGNQSDVTLSGSPEPLQPNGFSVLPGREFLLANVADGGGVWRASADGIAVPFVTEVHGRRVPGTNSVHVDAAGRAWISLSSWLVPRRAATRQSAEPDGCIILADGRGVRIAADGLGYTNEVRLHPSGDWLYVNETAGRRLTRFRVSPNAELGRRETVTEFTDGSFPDGLAFDRDGWCWVACIGSQRLIRVNVDTGEQHVVVDESGGDASRQAVDDRHRLDMIQPWYGADGKALGSMSSVCFGGPDLRTVYLGSLTRNAIASFRSPVPGAEPACWRF